MKVDFKKLIATYSAPHEDFALVEVPALQYLMVDGHGDPNSSPAYRDAVTSLYPIAYRIKFASKLAMGRDYAVMPLEALWWADEMSAFTTNRDESRWDWTLMTMVPDWIDHEHLDRARAAAARSDAPARDRVRLERLDEGWCVQTLHIGPYDAEGPVLDAMHHDVIPGRGLRMTGRHHEIYLSDARRTDPARLRTILRQPVTAEPA